ncbi:MAG: hypothetical protein N2Z21_06645 [Candidatus Sumerlaeaceae bacterium]|nr:hypothetical protein [Candidatus Sumerlaeaceae bacterium]
MRSKILPVLICTRSYYLGAVVVPIIFVFWSGVWSYQAFQRHFFDVEYFEARVAERLAETMKSGQCIVSLLKPTQEKMGGLNAYVRLVKQVQPCFRFASRLDDVPIGELVFAISPFQKFDEIDKKCAVWWKEERNTEYFVPVGYDTWRASIIGRPKTFLENHVTTDTAVLAKRVR